MGNVLIHEQVLGPQTGTVKSESVHQEARVTTDQLPVLHYHEQVYVSQEEDVVRESTQEHVSCN